MCLNLNSSYLRHKGRKLSKEKQTATKNILVWKSLTFFGSKSLFMDYKYNLFKTNPEIVLDINPWKNQIYQGYHSYKRAFRGEGWMPLDCFIIPKGSNYYEGEVNFSGREGYASSNIIYIGHLFNPITWFAIIYYKFLKQ